MDEKRYVDAHWYFDPAMGEIVFFVGGLLGELERPSPDRLVRIPTRQIRSLISFLDKEGFLTGTLKTITEKFDRTEDLKVIHRLLDTLQDFARGHTDNESKSRKQVVRRKRRTCDG